jgi:hypothetical protein
MAPDSAADAVTHPFGKNPFVGPADPFLSGNLYHQCRSCEKTKATKNKCTTEVSAGGKDFTGIWKVLQWTEAIPKARLSPLEERMGL